VLGFQGQTLLTYSGPGYNYTQTAWMYEDLTTDPGTVVPMWKIGRRLRPTRVPPWVAQTVNPCHRWPSGDPHSQSRWTCSRSEQPTGGTRVGRKRRNRSSTRHHRARIGVRSSYIQGGLRIVVTGPE